MVSQTKILINEIFERVPQRIEEEKSILLIQNKIEKETILGYCLDVSRQLIIKTGSKTQHQF